MSNKVVVIGLDSATPQLFFDQHLQFLPNIKKIMDKGFYIPMKSTMPPVTCPAWISMVTGKDPGQLGIYGFQNRKDYTYTGFFFVHSTVIKALRVWDIIGEKGLKSILFGIPPSYPAQPVNGNLVTCWLTPGTKSPCTFPESLKAELEANFGDYIFDVVQFAAAKNKDMLLERLYKMTDQHFKMVNYLIKNKPWDFFMMVEVGLDRLYHGFWNFFDKEHRDYFSDNPYKDVIPEYHSYLDKKVGELIDLFDEDTTIIMVSDHGSKKMEGHICFNEWLYQEGYLKLHSYPEKITPFPRLNIDWANTIAWGDDGLYGRLTLNVRGREPQGCVEPENYEKVLNKISLKLESMKDDRGNPLNTKVYKPKDLYSEITGIPHDLFVFFGDMSWRSKGTMGHKSIYSFGEDNHNNHDYHGICIINKPIKVDREVNIIDIAPTVLKLFNIDIPPDMHGKSLI